MAGSSDPIGRGFNGRVDVGVFMYAAFSIALLLMATAPAGSAEPAAGHRPKIGLVLGGGGALGFAHVGVLKQLEAQRIPIDCIAGTSMGSIIAGLYASGMSPDEIQTFLEGLDWEEVMSDDTPRRELFFRRKIDDQRYLFEVGVGRHGIKLGAGMAAGQKFNNMMEFITLRAAGVTNFDQFPIPYRAVATDLKTGEPYVIKSGRLSRAMRASMAVPGAFTPVYLDGRILVDGGVVDNLPVNAAKSMGADIIIAVDVGAAADKVDEESLKTLGGVLGRTYTIAQRPEQMEMFRNAAVGLQPELAGFTAAQFDRVAEIIPRGESAAKAKAGDLAPYRVSEEEYAKYLARQRRAPPAPPRIGAVAVSGNQRVNEAVILGRVRSEPGKPFDQAQVSRDLLRIYGLGEFEQVLARLTPVDGTTSDLTYDVSEKPSGPLYFKYGLQLRSDFDNDADWSMLLNLTRMSVNRLGAEWRNEAQIGSRQGLLSEFYQPLDASGFVFLAPNFEYESELQDVYENRKRIAEYDVQKLKGGVDVGLQLRQYAEFRVGPMWGRSKANVETGSSELPDLDDNLFGWKTSFTVDRQDRTVFARQGSYFSVDGEFARESLGGEREYDKVYTVYREQRSLGNHTGSLSLRYGTSPDGELPSYAQFRLGGPFGFAGIAENEFRGDCIGVGSLGYRYRLSRLPSMIGRAVYAMTRMDVGNVWQDESDMDIGDSRVGGVLGLGADTSLGPAYLGYGLADGGYSSWYFSLGTAF